MVKPFKLLFGKIKEILDERFPVPYTLDSKFRAFNGFAPFVLFIAALAFVVIALCINFANWDPDDNYITHLVYNTTLGSFIGFLSGGLEFTPATVVAIAFSSSLLPLCMESHNQGDLKPRWYVRVPCYVVYLLASSTLAVMLTGLFGTVGQWGFDTIVNLFNQETTTFFAPVGKILALIPLGYIALLLCLIAVKNYAEGFLFGLIGIIVVVILMGLLQLLPEEYAVLQEVLAAILLLAMLFGLDIVQSKAVGKFEEMLENM